MTKKDILKTLDTFAVIEVAKNSYYDEITEDRDEDGPCYDVDTEKRALLLLALEELQDRFPAPSSPQQNSKTI